MITVKNYETLSKLPSTPELGEYAVCIDDKTAYIYTENGWIKLDGKDAKLNVNLYELNKTLYRSLPEITFNKLQEQKKKIADWVYESDNKYYMLLCRERNDFTVFFVHIPSFANDNLVPIEKEVVDIVCSRGQIKAIEIEENFPERWVQFWVEDNKEIYMYAFFPYDSGVIECIK